MINKDEARPYEYKVRGERGRWNVQGWVLSRYIFIDKIGQKPNDEEAGALVGVNCQHCLRRLPEDEQVPMGTLCYFCENGIQLFGLAIEGLYDD